eukprot:230034_1
MFNWHILYLLFWLVNYTNSQSIFKKKDHNVENCIKKDEQLFCVSIQTITSLSTTQSFYVVMSDSLFGTDYNSSIITLSLITSATACFKYNYNNIIVVEIFNATSNMLIGDIKEIKMNSFSLESPEIISYTENTMDATFSIWIANNQCIEIVNGDMFIDDNFIINISFYRTNEDNSNIKSNIITSSIQNRDKNTWYTLLCVDGSPVNNLDSVGTDITISSYWTGYKYNLLYINNNETYKQFKSNSYIKYTGANDIIFHFVIGNVIIKYWQNCEISCNDKFGPCWDNKQYKLLQKEFPLYVMY